MYVMRGQILDRNDNVIAESKGLKGAYARYILYPDLSATVGYSNPDYGQTGIEASMDPYLRGVKGNTPSAYLFSRELYGQYPVGLDIRLSIDLDLQKHADMLLNGYTGGVIVMNASSGEILAMANSPTFDANQLDTQWATWMQEVSAPLLNRVTQGQYPAGTVTGPFILARFLAENTLPTTLPSNTWTTRTGTTSSCAVTPGTDPDWRALISSGCAAGLIDLSKGMTPSDVVALYSDLGLNSQPQIEIESAESTVYSAVSQISELYLTDAVRVSPLQVAVAAAELTNGGNAVKPTLVLAYKGPEGNWALITNDASTRTIPKFDAAGAVNLLQRGDSPVWSIVSLVQDQGKTVSWFVAGTPANWQGVPLVIVVTLEDSSPEVAAIIGQALVDDLLMNK
jgi:peptidoglycan glycosyltransferase